jgi:hypothetical protein
MTPLSHRPPSAAWSSAIRRLPADAICSCTLSAPALRPSTTFLRLRNAMWRRHSSESARPSLLACVQGSTAPPPIPPTLLEGPRARITAYVTSSATPRHKPPSRSHNGDRSAAPKTAVQRLEDGGSARGPGRRPYILCANFPKMSARSAWRAFRSTASKPINRLRHRVIIASAASEAPISAGSHGWISMILIADALLSWTDGSIAADHSPRFYRSV